MKYLIGNLKMNLINQLELERYFKSFKIEQKGKNFKNVDIVICPSQIHLKDFIKNLKSKKIKIGIQNVFWEKSGSFTGETSPSMLKNFGGEYAIIGHSERRRYFGETNEMVNLKIKLMLKERLTSIFCFGETMEERGLGLTSKIITDQIHKGLQDITPSGLEKIIFAYEPVWAVGTDVIPTSNGIMEVKILVKKILTEKYGSKYAQKSPILYGGSVKIKTLEQVCLDPGMDGVLIGRESLDPHEFLKIANILNSN